MRITEELRKYALGLDERNRLRCDLTVIADRIDAEHQKAIRELNNLADASVLLPVDADGECIHIGDELECIEALHPEVSARFKVQDMFYRGNGEWRLRAYPATYDPKKCRHHHKPTVEDVLRDFAYCLEDGVTDESLDEIVAEYAPKLQLRED